MIRKTIFISLLAASALLAKAQENIYMFEYSMGFPTGDLRDYIDEPSFRGFNFGYRYMLDENRALGLDIGWQTFYEKKDYATYTDGTSSITGIQYRYTNAFTASLQIDQVFNEGSDIRPFIGLGAGTSYMRRTLDMGLYRLERDPWQFMLQPEAGVSLYTTNGNLVMLTFNYYWGFATKQLDAQSFLAVGLAYAFGD
ncbi:MAG: hypothetical protein JNL52_12065 [Flavobacteriales bacterium]|nr:hypothetical protein [Flavobacteriales bacterium]